MALQLGFRDLSLDQLVKGSEVRSPFLLRRCEVVLEGSDLSLELVLELTQCLLLTDDILAVEKCLLPIAIRLCLLLLHLFLHVDEHLKLSVFVLLQWLDSSGCLMKRGVDVLDGMRLISDWLGDRAPSGADGLAFGHGVVEDDCLLSWAISAIIEAF